MNLGHVDRKPGPDFLCSEPSVEQFWHQWTVNAEHYLIEQSGEAKCRTGRGQALQFVPNTPGAPQTEWDGVAVTKNMVDIRKKLSARHRLDMYQRKGWHNEQQLTEYQTLSAKDAEVCRRPRSCLRPCTGSTPS